MYAEKLAPLRRQLADAKARQFNTEREAKRLKVEIETRLVKEKGGDLKAFGPNAPAQQSAIGALVDADPAYSALASLCDTLDAEIAKCKVEIEVAEDERREWEWRIKETFANALSRFGVPLAVAEIEAESGPNGATFDAVQDEMIDVAAAKWDAGVNPGNVHTLEDLFA